MEAVTQLTEMKNDTIDITNYVLRDVSIKKALVTPDDDIGIEVIFNMRPAVHNEDKAKEVWWDFNVSSIDQDGVLKDHMAGSISINIRTSRPKPRESVYLNQKASGKEWNQALRGVGFDYGPTFADMAEINFNGVDYICTCKTKIKTTVGTLEGGESRHVLHPATVDSTLQLMIASVYAGRNKAMAAGIIPIQVDEVSIWVPTAAQLEDGNGSVTAWTDQRGIRSFVCGNELIGHDGQVLMEMKNLRGTFYEAAVPQTASRDMKPMPYGEMIWKLDVDNLSEFEDVESFVDLRVFKMPSTRVLDIGGTHSIGLLSKHPELDYTAISGDGESLKTTLASFENAKYLDVVLDGNLSEQGLKIASFDVVISTPDIKFAGLSELINSNGQVIIVESDKPVKLAHGSLTRPSTVSKLSSGTEVQLVYRSISTAVLDDVVK